MKKYFILLISLFLLSCASEKQQTFNASCPDVFFSKDHSVYIASEENIITLDNISYKAIINNSNFVQGCKIIDNNFIMPLSILFVINPDKAKKVDLIIPYYIAVIDNQNNILDIEYYKAIGSLNKNVNKSSYIETEIITIENIIIPIKNIKEGFTNKLLIGFMLNQEKIKILN